MYETGQYTVQTPDRPLFGSMQQAFYGGQSPWQYEALYINRAKLVLKTSGMALSREMAEMVYSVDYYIHVETREAALQLVQHMPYRGHALTTQEVNAYSKRARKHRPFKAGMNGSSFFRLTTKLLLLPPVSQSDQKPPFGGEMGEMGIFLPLHQ